MYTFSKNWKWETAYISWRRHMALHSGVKADAFLLHQSTCVHHKLQNCSSTANLMRASWIWSKIIPKPLSQNLKHDFPPLRQICTAPLTIGQLIQTVGHAEQYSFVKLAQHNLYITWSYLNSTKSALYKGIPSFSWFYVNFSSALAIALSIAQTNKCNTRCISKVGYSVQAHRDRSELAETFRVVKDCGTK